MKSVLMSSSYVYFLLLIIIIYLSWSLDTWWPVPVLRVQSLFKGLPWFLLPAGEWRFITLLWDIMFTWCIQLLLYSSECLFLTGKQFLKNMITLNLKFVWNRDFNSLVIIQTKCQQRCGQILLQILSDLVESSNFWEASLKQPSYCACVRAVYCALCEAACQVPCIRRTVL
jgi:hypothetical protein